MFGANDVQDLLLLADALSVEVWLEGGWGVDALLGEQTREHEDIDIVLEARHAEALLGALKRAGYSEQETSFTTKVHTVWADIQGRTIDLHLIEFDQHGNGVFGPDLYPAHGLKGCGTIGGRHVRCITPEVQLEFHAGYEPDANDVHDVTVLCRRFNLPLPDQYRKLSSG
jgi:lincosamide nucleotidyltransferase A/C/D/E